MDHIGRLGVGTGITRAQPPFSANSDVLAQVDDAGIHCGAALSRCCRSRRPRPGFLHHQPPFPGDVAGQRPPGHVAGFEAVTFGGEHVASLKAETGPRAGHVDAVVRVHRGHAAISSLLGSREGRQDLIQSHTHAKRRITPFRIMYIM